MTKIMNAWSTSSSTMRNSSTPQKSTEIFDKHCLLSLVYHLMLENNNHLQLSEDGLFSKNFDTVLSESQTLEPIGYYLFWTDGL